MNETPCSKLRKLIEERTSGFEFEEVKLENGGCVLDYKDKKLVEEHPELELKFGLKLGLLIGSLELDKRANLESSDIPVGIFISGEESKLSTNRIRFPDKCEIMEVHMYDHEAPAVHFHIKCPQLGEKGLNRLADVVVRTTRRTREYAGIS